MIRKETLYMVVTLLLSAAQIFAQSESLPIGTVIYSILKPEIFLKDNSAWMLLDGCDSVLSKKIYGDPNAAEKKFQTSFLHTQWALEKLPDARGIFLRGMNLDRSIDSGDVNGNRDAGVYQKDEFQQHKHSYKDNSVIGIRSDDANDRDVGSNPSDVDRSTLPAGTSSETRPRNIALYIYIKVN